MRLPRPLPLKRWLRLGTAWRRILFAMAAAAVLTPAAAQVGMTQIQSGGLSVTLVYPTLLAATPQAIGPFPVVVALDSPPAPRNDGGTGRRSLIVLSHGTGGSPLADHQLAATLARAGFVVAQPLHQGDNHLDSSRAGPDAWQSRPREITRTLDALAAHPQWNRLLDVDRVGVHGMSAGGATALTMAGAGWRVLDLVNHCHTHLDDDPGFCFNGLPDPQRQNERRASFERARGVPESYLPAFLTTVHGAGLGSRPDARVVAVTVSVPVAALFSEASLQGIRVPVGVISAGRDTMLLPRFHSDRLLRHCGACEPIAHLAGAGHMDLLGPWPAALALAAAAQQARGGMPEPGFDGELRQKAFDGVAVFYQRQLRP